MKKITKLLSEEHKNIMLVIEALKRESLKITENTAKINKEFFAGAIDFIRNYADKIHHAKEEDILFKEINKSAGDSCNPVRQMLHEHEIGRKYVKGMEKSLKENNAPKLAENAMGYADLLAEHIFKEDNILYPMADGMIGDKVFSDMEKKIQKIKADKDISKSEDKYQKLAKKLSGLK